MKILVTGGAGFIGSHLTEFFLSQTDNDVCCFDNFDTYYDLVSRSKISKIFAGIHGLSS
jgi:nucleoside-diphosphate-sugar epimerase